MTHQDSYAAGDAEREALATLIARFSADRDTLAAGVQRADAAVCDLATRLDALVARIGDDASVPEIAALRLEMARFEALVDALRGEVAGLRGDLATPHAEAGSGGAPALMAVVEEVRDELRRTGVEIGAQAAHHAERVATGVAESSAEAHRALATALADARVQLTRAIEEVQRVALAGGERATQALAQTADFDRRGRELEALRGTLAQLRDEALRRIEETEARFGVRLDSIVAGVEAETRAVRDGLWDRVSGAEQRLQEAEALLARIRVELPQATAQALEGVAAVYGEIGELRDGLGSTDERLAELERQGAARGGLGGLVACVRDEIVAAVMTVVSIGAVVGRLTLGLVR